jgi:hypothetical protein
MYCGGLRVCGRQRQYAANIFIIGIGVIVLAIVGIWQS